jgi:hypothetical protein
MLGRGGLGGRGVPYGVPAAQQIEEVDEDEFEDLQLYPFDEPTSEDVLWMAQLMGIHPIRDKQYLYLAQEALINPPNEEWMIFKDIAGNVIWINEITDDMEPHPPHLQELMENFQRVKQKQTMMSNRSTSNDKSNAMKKILGRNLSSTDPVPIETAVSAPTMQQKQPQGRLPPKNQQPPAPQPVAKTPPPQAEPPKRGGGMSLLKALQHAQQQEAAETSTGAPPTRPPDNKKQVSKPESKAEDSQDEEDSDEVFNRKIGDPSDDEYGEQGLVAEEEQDDEEEVEKDPHESFDASEDAEEVFQAKTKAVENRKPAPPSNNSKNEPAKLQRGASEATKSSKVESKPSKNMKDSTKKETEKANTNKTKNSQVDDIENSNMISKLMQEFQEMQMKMSKIEQENSMLRQKNDEISSLKAELGRKDLQQSKVFQEHSESNIKDGIAEIKKLLEKSILIQNEKGQLADRNFEENRSIIVPTIDLNRPSDYIRNTLGAHQFSLGSHEQSGAEIQRQSHLVNQTSKTLEYDAKWTGIILREKEFLHTSKLSLQNEKLLLENRKLAIKKHEFEMKRELEQMKLQYNHPLALKIRSNLTQQVDIFRSEHGAWKEKCSRYLMKQKNISLLEKSFQFSRASGGITELADKHLEELYEMYRDNLGEQYPPDVEKELGFSANDDGLSLDTHALDIESEQNNLDDVQSRSDKHSHTDMSQRPIQPNWEPTEFTYNLNDIRRSMGGTDLGPSTYNMDRLGDSNRDSIRKYFTNQSQFYSSIRKEVPSTNLGRTDGQQVFLDEHKLEPLPLLLT